MALYTEYKSELFWKGKRYKLNLSVFHVLKAQEILMNPEIGIGDRVSSALSVLTNGPHPVEVPFLEAIFSTLKRGEEKNGEKLFDFFQDESLIFSAFMQTYQINLRKDSKSIHWLDFIDLLNGLPKDTRFMEVVGIRGAEIPRMNKNNAEKVRRLMDLKMKFALKKSPEESASGYQEGLSKLANSLMALSEGEDKCYT